MYYMPMHNVAGVFVLLAVFGLLFGFMIFLVWMEDKAPGLPKVLLFLALFLWGVSLLPF